MPPPRSRYSTAARGLVVAVLALVFASLLNAQGLRKTAEIQPPGLGRSIALALTRPLVRVSHALYLDRPRQELKAAMGRGNDDRIDTTVALPPPAPRRRPASRRPPVPAATTGPARVTTTVPAPGGAGPSASAPRPRPRPAFSPSHPLRVWVAGDSLAQVPGDSLERAAGTGGPVDVVGVESRLATGLGRPDVYNWYLRFPAAIEQLRPRVAVFSFGGDDGHNYMSGVPAGRTIGPLGSPSWDAEYRRRLDGVQRELEDAGVFVVWLGLPIIRGPMQNRSFVIVNKLVRSVAAEHPQTAAYVDAHKLFESPTGGYTDYLREGGKLVLMRATDGVHYQPAAGDLIAKAVLAILGKKFDLTSWKHRPAAKSG